MGSPAARRLADRRRWPRLALAVLLALAALLAAAPAPAAASGGDAWAWGSDASGQLGDGTIDPERATPAPVAGLPGAVALDAGQFHNLALLADGTVWAWGRDGEGQLGDGTIGPDRATPAQVIGLTGVVAISAGAYHSLALQGDGTVWAWGSDTSGQLGDGTVGADRATPVQVAALTGVVAISAGNFHSLALKGDGIAWGWGDDGFGQLGDGTVATPASRPTRSPVAVLTGVVAISAGGSHSLALKGDGTVWAWGRDDEGQLGDGNAGSPRPTPVAVGGLAGVVAVAAGGTHSLALQGDGTVAAWGYDSQGQLGDGVIANPGIRATAAPVGGLAGVVAISASVGHNLALNADGTVAAWGYDFNGQLGDGTIGSPESRATPAPVAGLAGAVAISAGGFHSLALTTVKLAVGVVGPGAVARSPAGLGAGPFGYAQGTAVALTPNPAPGGTFVGWAVDGVPRGWANPLTVTMNAPHTAQATFVPTAAFPDVGAGRADYVAITQLASRGTIKGYQDGRYGPDDRVRRDQMAALIARATPFGPGTPTFGTLTPPGCLVAGTWDCENWGTNFSDRGGIDANLWRNIGALQHYGVSIGYAGATCAAKGVPSPCYGPGDDVTYAQTISFITRAMKAKGYWLDQPAAPLLYANVPSAHQLDVRTFHFYTNGLGGIPAAPGTLAGWDAGATRGWFARALWLALDSYWGTDGLLPDGRPAGGYAP